MSFLTNLGDIFSSPYESQLDDWDNFGDGLHDDLHYRADNLSIKDDANSEDEEEPKEDTLIDFHDDMFEIFDELGEELFASGGSVTEKVADILVEKRKQLEERNAAIRRRLETASGVKLLDKVTFFFGVINVGLTAFIAGKFPHYMPYWYSLKFVTLVGARLIVYKAKKWHYFLFDFCYFANLLLMTSIWLFPNNMTLFKLCFSFANGPLAFAVLAWRNSLVFHSLDKVTSVFIHIGPMMATHNLRWWAAEEPDNTLYRLCANDACSISFVEATLWPLIPYAVWQLLYYIKVEWLSPNRNYTTSFRHLVKHSKSGIVYQICSKFEERWQQPVFMLIQLAFTLLTMLPAKLLFDYEWLSTLFYIAIAGVSIWNGGCFYIEVFAKKYLAQLPNSSATNTPSKRRSRASSRIDPAQIASLVHKDHKQD